MIYLKLILKAELFVELSRYHSIAENVTYIAIALS